MSTSIISEVLFARMPGAEFGLPEDLYAMLTLSGDSNCYAASGARARSWGCAYVGTEADMVALAVEHSRYFEGRVTVWKNMGSSGVLSPQQWISKIRRLLSKAAALQVAILSAEHADIQDLSITGKGESKGKSIREVFTDAYAWTLAHPGGQTWQFLAVEGPGTV